MPISYALVIRDPIHGSIPLTELEKKIIDEPIFQRLRHLKQLGFLSYVFPSATHSRFEHSIGCMHLAGKLFLQLLINQENLLKQHSSSQVNRPLVVEIINTEAIFHQLKTREEQAFQTTRLAGLLHDLGHGPLSHISEKYLSQKVTLQNLIHSLQEIKCMYAPLKFCLLTCFKTKIKHGETLHHEHLSLFFCALLEILKNESHNNDSLSPQVLLADALAILDEDIPLLAQIDSYQLKEIDKNFDASHFEEKIKANSLFQTVDKSQDLADNSRHLLHLLISSDFDADRMDYLLRDATFTGVNYGLFDQERISEHLYFAQPQNKSTQLLDKPMLITAHGAVRALEDYFLCRYQMYLQVYTQKTNTCFEALFEKLLATFPYEPPFYQQMTASPEKKISSHDDDIIQNFLSYTDTAFTQGLMSDLKESIKIKSSNQEKLTLTNLYTNNLLEKREPWKLVFECQLNAENEKKLVNQQMLFDLAKALIDLSEKSTENPSAPLQINTRIQNVSEYLLMFKKEIELIKGYVIFYESNQNFIENKLPLPANLKILKKDVFQKNYFISSLQEEFVMVSSKFPRIAIKRIYAYHKKKETVDLFLEKLYRRLVL